MNINSNKFEALTRDIYIYTECSLSRVWAHVVLRQASHTVDYSLSVSLLYNMTYRSSKQGLEMQNFLLLCRSRFLKKCF